MHNITVNDTKDMELYILGFDIDIAFSLLQQTLRLVKEYV